MPVDPAVQARYARRMEALIRKGERLSKAELGRLFRLLDTARKEVKALLLDAPTDWQLAHYDALRQRIENILGDVGEKLGKDMAAIAGDKWKTGVDVTDDLMREFGAELALAGVPLDLSMLSTLTGFSVDLIQDLPVKTMRNIATTLQLGIMGGKTPYEVMVEIGATLVDEDGNPAPGVWGDVFYRAETIQRTEAGRILSIAEQERMGQWDKDRPGLLKTWKHGGPAVAQPRETHIQAGIDYAPGGTPGPIPWDEPFIVGGESMMYPLDPGASPGNTINCHCAHGPWREEWA